MFLNKFDCAARALRDRIISRSTRLDSQQLVNATLVASGRSAIDEREIHELLREVNEDHHLSAAYDLVRPRLLADEPGAKKIPFACWRDRATTLTSLSSVCYALIRVLRPAHIVETGVWFGASTALMLAALHKNRHGRLTSIDLPGFADMSGNASGFDHPFIPDVYKDRWDLRVADATVELPRVFINERPDMFMHDSDHSYQHMVFEFSIAAKYLAKQSVLISDDVRRNSAFYDVMSQVKATVFNHVQNPNIGVAIL